MVKPFAPEIPYVMSVKLGPHRLNVRRPLCKKLGMESLKFVRIPRMHAASFGFNHQTVRCNYVDRCYDGIVTVERSSNKTLGGDTYPKVALNYTLTCLFENHFSGETQCALNHTLTTIDLNCPRLVLAQEHTLR